MADDSAKKATPAKKAAKKAASGKKTAAKKAAPPRAGRSRDALLGQELTPRERRCIMLTALGYTDSKIAKSLGGQFGIVSTATAANDILTACAKLGVGRNGAAIWAVDQLEGEVLERQRAAAERRRSQLRASGVLTPQRVQVAILFANPEHTDKSQHDIGQLVHPEPISSQLVSRYVRDLVSNIGPDGSLTKLVAILRLAPLSERRTDDEQPEETL